MVNTTLNSYKETVLFSNAHFTMYYTNNDNDDGYNKTVMKNFFENIYKFTQS